MFNLEAGVLLNIFNSSQVAAVYISSLRGGKPETLAGRIFIICKENKGHAYGYVWRFLSNSDSDQCLAQEELQKEHKTPRAKAIQQFDLENNLIAEFESAASYSKAQSTEYKRQRQIARGINGCCLGDSKTYLGFV